MRPIVSRAPLGVAEHFPRCIELQDPMLIATGIRVVLLHQGAIGGLDLRRRGGGSYAQNLIGVASRGRPGQEQGKGDSYPRARGCNTSPTQRIAESDGRGRMRWFFHAAMKSSRFATLNP